MEGLRNSGGSEFLNGLADEMMHDRSRALSEMTSSLIHEMTQPLSSVSMLAQNLMLGIDNGLPLNPNDIRDTMAKIVHQADSLSSFLSHASELQSKMESGERTKADLRDVAASAARMVDGQMRDGGVELELELGESPLFAIINPFAIEECVIQLLRNAREAVEDMPDESGGGGRGRKVVLSVKSRGRPRPGGNKEGVINVSDSGPGVPQDILPRVGMPFVTTKAKGHGSGLGLYMTRRLIEASDGRLQVASSGNGVSASLVLPLI